MMHFKLLKRPCKLFVFSNDITNDACLVVMNLKLPFVNKLQLTQLYYIRKENIIYVRR